LIVSAITPNDELDTAAAAAAAAANLSQGRTFSDLYLQYFSSLEL